MESSTILAMAIAALVALGVLVAFTSARRRDVHAVSRETVKKDKSASAFLGGEGEIPTGRDVERAAVLERRGDSTALVPAGAAPPAPWIAPDPEIIGVTRRQFFNRSIVAMMGLGLTGFGAAVLAFLWPQLGAGFGSKITAGKLDDILGKIRDGRQPFYVAEGRFYLSPYPADAISKAKKAYSPAILPGMEAGVVALYQKCVHLGCRVPFCTTAQWFECGCHGSKYNRVGEKKGGPAPRGLDRFPVEVTNGIVTVNTGQIVVGPAIGTNTTGQEAEGPHCVGEVHH
ncbi:MAG: cytochrome b6-f complex iron-sulfur subunit [Actinomycetota bacterium]|jgi:cytochrome b6-f complex iron-sulfur subunit|nr:cytochrome b6-f complex iron-sulfur subunit [Actinomycetota bacterium]